MTEPEAFEGDVHFEQEPNETALEPGEAEAKALSILSAASKARSQRARQELEHESHLWLAALARRATETAGWSVGYTCPLPEWRVRGDGEEYRMLWFVTPHGDIAEHVPVEEIPAYVESSECPFDPDHADDLTETLAEYASRGGDRDDAERVDADRGAVAVEQSGD